MIIHIQANGLKSLPESLLNLTSLKTFGFDDFYEKESLDANSVSILDHLRRIGVGYPISID